MPDPKAQIRSVAISTSFPYHAAHSGYARILEYTQPLKVFGANAGTSASLLKQRYQWLFEFDAALYIRKYPVDLIHILSGEDYFRFSGLLTGGIPVVATFHLPADLLRREVRDGDLGGRAAKFAHHVSGARFGRLAAAIALSSDQKEVLSQVMPSERIAVIPHGIDANHYRSEAASRNPARNMRQILTVGDWLRDWDFYFQFVRYCGDRGMDWEFQLINRKLHADRIVELKDHPNVTYRANVSDDDLIDAYLQSGALLLPLQQAAANNALLESLVLGCPVVMTDVVRDDFYGGDCVRYFTPGDMEHAAKELTNVLTHKHFAAISERAIEAAKALDWTIIAARTLELYASVLSNKIT